MDGQTTGAALLEEARPTIDEQWPAVAANVADAAATSIATTKASEFWAGFRETIPLEVGAIPFGIIFGAVAVTSGLSGQAAAAMSALVFAGSSQFIAAGLVAGGAGIPIIVLTTFVVNLRHALYGVSLAPYMKHLPQRWLLPLGFWLTDESYLVVIKRFQQPDASPYKHWFYLGSAITMYVNWQICTWIGIVAGSSIPNPLAWGLDFALPVTFIGMLVPSIRRRSMLMCVIAAGAAAVAFAGLPSRLGLLAAILAGIVVGVATKRFDRDTA
jgi:4-azaleucine resistance transporter AzlC